MSANAFGEFRKSKKPGLQGHAAASRKRTRQQQPPVAVPLDAERCSSPELEERLSFEQQERVLKAFDLSSKFGPCTGMTRRERWLRAEKLGLEPPSQVRDILDDVGPESPLQQNVWHGRI